MWLHYLEFSFIFMPTLTTDPLAIVRVVSAEEPEWSIILLTHLCPYKKPTVFLFLLNSNLFFKENSFRSYYCFYLATKTYL